MTVSFGKNDAKAETSILWPPHVKGWLTGKDSDAGRDLEQGEKGTTEDEMAGWHHRLDGREFEWTPGVGDGQGGMACCNSWGHKEFDTTERLNWSELYDCGNVFFVYKAPVKILANIGCLMNGSYYFYLDNITFLCRNVFLNPA